MSGKPIWSATIALSLAALLSIAVAAHGQRAERGAPAVGPSMPAAKGPDTFRIAGRVAGLYPGAQRPLRLKLTNPHRFGIRVTSIRVRVHDASQGCSAGNLVIGRLRRRPYLRRLGGRRAAIPIWMLSSAPNACQGATFPLTFTGAAVKR